MVIIYFCLMFFRNGLDYLTFCLTEEDGPFKIFHYTRQNILYSKALHDFDEIESKFSLFICLTLLFSGLFISEIILVLLCGLCIAGLTVKEDVNEYYVMRQA